MPGAPPLQVRGPPKPGAVKKEQQGVGSLGFGTQAHHCILPIAFSSLFNPHVEDDCATTVLHILAHCCKV